MAGELRRAIGLRTVVATATGLPFAALQYLAVAGLVTYVAGDAGWIAVGVAGLLVLIVWGLFSELNGILPTAAGVRLWMARAIDDRTALVLTFTYLTTIVVVIAADAYIVASAVAHTLGQATWLAGAYIPIVLGLATWANLRGIVAAGRTEVLATTVVIVGTVTVALIGLAKEGFALESPARPLAGHSAADFVEAVALGVFLYGAFEWVTTQAEEVRDPARTIPRGMLIALGILFVSCSILAMAMSHLLSSAQLDRPYPQLFLGQAALGDAGLWVMMAITAVTAINTFNGGFIAASRFMYATAREGSLPPRFALLNERAVPYVPVVVLALGSLIGAVLVAATERWQVLVAVGAALEALLYATAGLCVYRLRRREADAPRPFRMRAARPLAVVAIVVFGVLALAASTSVDEKTDITPLAIILGFAGVSAYYVHRVVPRLRAQEAERRRAATARRRQRRARGAHADQQRPAPSREEVGPLLRQGGDEGGRP